MAALVGGDFKPLFGLLDHLENLIHGVGLCAAVLHGAKLGKVVDGLGLGSETALGAGSGEAVPLDAQLGGPCGTALVYGAGAVGVVHLFGRTRPGGLLLAAEHTVDRDVRDLLFTFYAEHGGTS